jgi:CheY-like chemotaxis protein
MASVLIIEDDTILAKMYQRAFQVEQIPVELAFDGEEGLKKALTMKPSIILLDVMMPKMSGYQVLDAIRSDEVTKEIPVVVLTNLSSVEDTNLAISKGATQVMVKSQSDPFQVVALTKQFLAKSDTAV